MELKNYQKKVMEHLSAYMNALDKTSGLYAAWRTYWAEQDIAVGAGGVPLYNNAIDGVPPCLCKGSYRRWQNIYCVCSRKADI